MNVPLIETKGLKKYFKTAKGELHAVDGVNLTIEKRQHSGRSRRVRMRQIHFGQSDSAACRTYRRRGSL